MDRVKEIRANVLILALLGIALCMGLAFFVNEERLAMLGAGLIGAIGASMTKLVDPPAEPPPPTVPAETMNRLIALLEKGRSD